MHRLLSVLPATGKPVSVKLYGWLLIVAGNYSRILRLYSNRIKKRFPGRGNHLPLRVICNPEINFTIGKYDHGSYDFKGFRWWIYPFNLLISGSLRLLISSRMARFGADIIFLFQHFVQQGRFSSSSDKPFRSSCADERFLPSLRGLFFCCCLRYLPSGYRHFRECYRMCKWDSQRTASKGSLFHSIVFTNANEFE